MLIAGAIDFVVFIERRNDYAPAAGCAGSSTACARSTASTAGCCPARSSRPARTATPCRARPDPCLDELDAVGYRPDDREVGVSWSPRSTRCSRIARRRARGRRRAVLLVASLASAGCRPAERPARQLTERLLPADLAARARWLGAAGLGAARAAGHPLGGRRRRRRRCSRSSAGARSAAPRRAAGRSPGSRAWPPGPSRCATPSPARSGWSRRSRHRYGAAAPILQAAAGPAGRPAARARMPLPDALQQFADDLDDPGADLIMAALDAQRPAARPGPARRARRRCRSPPARSWTCAGGSTPSRATTRRSVQIVVV